MKEGYFGVSAMPAIATEIQEGLQASEPGTGSSYGRILKSSALVGGSSVLNIAIGVVRTKVIASLLGPAGFGLFGLYGSITGLVQAVAGMGVNSSGVRQIAEAAGSSQTTDVGHIAMVLRRVSLISGILGGAVLLVFAREISNITFGNDHHARAVAGLSVVVFFSLISGGQSALIQGLRRIGDLAKVGVLGSLLGTLISIPLVYFFRERGVVPSLASVAIMMTATSWWYSRKARTRIPTSRFATLTKEVGSLLKLGFAFMASSLLTLGAAYLIRIMLVRRVGFEATGLYQSAWTLGGLYAGFILQAMGADFYPRLSAHASDNTICNRLVNEQTHVGLLLAGPGVLATLTFAPLVIALFYSAKFGGAVPILRWISLGAILQVMTWPLGFIIIAKARQAIFIGCEIAWTIVSLGLAWIGISFFGAVGAGIAFFGSYVVHAILLYMITSQMSGFRWSSANKKISIGFTAAIAVVFFAFHLAPFTAAVTIGVVATLGSAIYSTRELIGLVDLAALPAALKNILRFTGLGRMPGGIS
ncbi:O-antigen translocase [Granulicella arctica]|uniref:O-antigen translocase n=1 Tax=Granulicella arctica TaxID=940613 RepID=UPI0021DF53E6|nr:O-antigen translocase [Granulicella arctica]